MFFLGKTAAHELKITAMFLSKAFQNQLYFEIHYTTRGNNKIPGWKVLHKGNLYYLSFGSNMGFKIYIWDIHLILLWFTYLVTLPSISITSKFPEASWNQWCFLKDQILSKSYPEKRLVFIPRK